MIDKDPNAIGEGISNILSNIAFGVAGNALYEFLIRPAIKSLLPLHAHDQELRKAFAVSFKEATKRLKKQEGREDGRKILQQLYDDTPKLFPIDSSAFPDTIIEVMLTGDESSLQQMLWSLIERPYFMSEPPAFRDEMKRKFPLILISTFGDVLKDERYQPAWIDFQRELLQETQRLLKLHTGALTAEQQRAFAETLKRLDTIAGDTALLKQMAFTTAETLSYVGRIEEQLSAQAKGTNAHVQALAELLKQAVDQQQARFEKLERDLRRKFEYMRYPGREAADQIEKLVLDYKQLFVGREEAFAELNDFLAKKCSGTLTITAQAGFGKTALLANWLTTARTDRYFVTYHFFNSRYEATRSLTNAYRNLLRQLYNYYDLNDEPLPTDDGTLRDTLWGLLRDRGARSDQSLIILLDGLDEAKDTFPPPFPSPLPDGVFVIVSARADEGEKPKYLQKWTDDTLYLHLKRLPRMAIADYIRRVNNDVLALFAEDEGFIRLLDEKTEGFPLYLQYLTEELIQALKSGQDAKAVLAGTPKKFKTYVGQQIDALLELSNTLNLPERIWMFFALLTVTKGALSREEVKAKELAGMSSSELGRIQQVWQVTRWLRITEEADITYYAFAHPLLAEAFAEAEFLSDEAQEAQERLLTFCEQWQEHRSRYAFQYYAEHLREAQRYDQLFAVARDDAFRKAQVEVFPDEPDLPLNTVQTALLAAAEIDNAGDIAEFLLLHAKRVMEATYESPLDALRLGNVWRARELVDLFDAERAVLWQLLLTWELKDAGKQHEARAILEGMLTRELPRLTGWQCLWAVDLLAYLAEINEDSVVTLQAQLLDDDARSILSRILATQRRFASAEKVAQHLEHAGKRVLALITIASLQSEAGEKEEEIEGMWMVSPYGLVPAEIPPSERPMLLLANIAVAKARTGEFVAALETIQSITEQALRAKAMANLTIAQAQAGAFNAALQTMESVEDNDLRDEVLSIFVATLAQSGELTNAEERLKEIEDEIRKTDVLVAIIGAYAKERKFSVALELAQRIEQDWGRVDALSTIAEAQVEAGAFVDALATARKIPRNIRGRETAGSEVLMAIALAKTEAGDVENALEATKEIEQEDLRTSTYTKIAMVQAQKGDLVEAQAILATALDAAQVLQDKTQQAVALARIAAAYAHTENSTESQALFTAALSTARGIEKEPRGYKNWQQIKTMKSIAEIQVEVGEYMAAFETVQEFDLYEWTRSIGFADYMRPDPLESFDTIAESAREDEERFKAFVMSLTSTGQVALALDIARRIQDEEKRAWTLKVIAETQVAMGESAAARATMAIALEKVKKSSEDERLRSRALKDVVSVQARMGNIAAAMETLQEIKDGWWDSWARVDIARTLAWAGDFAAAGKVISQAEYGWAVSQGWVAVAEALAQAGDFEQSLLAVEEIRDDQDTQEGLATIAEAQAQVGEFTSAFETVQKIKDEGDRPEHMVAALTAIAEAQAQAGDYTAAQETAQRIEYYGDRAVALASIGAIQARAGHTEDAQSSFTMALEAVQDLAEAKNRAVGLAAVARAQAVAGQLDGAYANFTTALETARTITRESEREEALAVVAVMQARAGFTEQAISTVERMLTKRNEYLPRVANALRGVGDVPGFKRLLIPCAYYLDAAYRMCGLLAWAYPEQVTAVAAVVSTSDQEPQDKELQKDRAAEKGVTLRRSAFVRESFSERQLE